MIIEIELSEESRKTLVMMVGKIMWREGKEHTINQAAGWVVANECRKIREKIEKEKERDSDWNTDRDEQEDTTTEASTTS